MLLLCIAGILFIRQRWEIMGEWEPCRSYTLPYGVIIEGLLVINNTGYFHAFSQK
jgi:hypothetical protein